MKLYLLRHANASESSIGDFQRELSNKGIVQCEALEQFVLPKLNDDLVDIYCSAAKRTKQTHLHIFKTRKTSFDKKLYLASASALLHFICELETDRTLVLIGHNNGLSDLASYLTDCIVGMQTASCIEIQFSCVNSSFISKGTGSINSSHRCQVSQFPYF